jgi:basic membrane protein A
MYTLYILGDLKTYNIIKSLHKEEKKIMIINRLAIIAVVATASFVLSLQAHAETKPGLLYDLGGKFDRSFNENAYNGAEQYKKETGNTYMEFELTNEAQREQSLRTFAQQGVDPIVVVGFAWAPALEKVAPEFPDTRFSIIDTEVELPNVQSLEFDYAAGSYIVGVLAGRKTETDTVGFVGGMDVPIIRQFACAYKHGARYANSDVGYIENMTGSTPAAWNDPTRGRELALGQFDRGADIVFAAAGGTTVGILQAAADADKLAIGVGMNQNGMQPGHVLTSATASVDTAVYLAFKDGGEGTWKPGLRVLGLADGGVGWSLDENNRPLVDAEDETAVTAAIEDIIAGKIVVPDYMTDNSCPD